jgi:plasmid stabilization system protein ParE
MKYNVVALRRADDDVRHIARWLFKSSPSGALAWLQAYERLIELVSANAEMYPAAIEDSESSISLKEALFRTRRGRTYRAIFTIVGDEVRILRVRGPGQPPLKDDELLGSIR